MKARDTGGGAGGAMENPMEEWEDFTEGLGETGIGFEGINFDALLEEAKAEFDKLFNEELPAIWDDAFGKMRTELQPHLQGLMDAWDTFAADVKLPSWDEISSAWTEGDSLLEKFTNVLSVFEEDIKTNGGILGILGRIAGNLWDNISANINTSENRKKFSDAVNSLVSSAGDFLADALLGSQAPATITMPTGVILEQATVGEQQSGWSRLGDALLPILTQIGMTLGQALVSGIWSGIGVGIETMFDIDTRLSSALFLGPQALAFESANRLGLDIFDGILDGIDQGIVDAGTNWDTTFAPMIDSIAGAFGAKSPATTMIPIGISIVDGLVLGIIEQIGTIDIPGIFGTIIDSVLDFFGINNESGESQTFFEFGVAMITGLTSGFTETISTLFGENGIISSSVEDFIESVREAFGVDETTTTGNPFINLGAAIMNGINEGLLRFKSAILQTVADLGLEIPDWLAKILGAASPAKVMIPIGKSIVQGVAVGIEKSANGLRSSIEGVKSQTTGLFSDMSSLRYSGASARGSFSPTMQAQPVMSSSSVNFGNVYINDKMDWATFKNQVHRAVLEG